MTLRLRRGTDLQRQSITFSEGELVYVTDTGEIYVGDGSTVGGNLIVGGGGITSALTSNLNLSGYEINGTGNIAINGIVSALAIDSGIVSVDSTLIVDNVNSAFYGSFIGDGSLITNISLGDLNDFNIGTLSPGDVISWDGTEWTNTPVTGASSTFVGDLVGSVFSDSSSKIIDGITGTIFSDLIKHNSGAVTIENVVDGSRSTLTVNTIDEISRLILVRKSSSTIDNSMVYGRLDFEKNDPSGLVTTATVGADNLGLFFSINPTGITATESEYVVFSASNNLGIGVFDPQTKLEIKNGSLRFNDNRTYTSIASPTTGEMMYDTVTTSGGLYIYNNTSGWTRAVVEELGENATVLSTFLKLGASDTSTRDGFGSDSNSIDGAIFYNMDAERIQYYQADSWFNMPNQSLEEDADVRFASVTANTFISTGGGAPTLESETVIDLQAGERVRVTTSPFRLAQLTTTERNAISPVAGDLIYNTTDNRFQGYQNGAWINLDDGTAA